MENENDENDYVPVTLRASVRGGMKPGYMCSTSASRQTSKPIKPQNVAAPQVRRPFRDMSNRASAYVASPRATPTPRALREASVRQPITRIPPATPRHPSPPPPLPVIRVQKPPSELKRKYPASARKKDAATNTEIAHMDDIETLIDLLKNFELDREKNCVTCVICVGKGENGWRAMVPCGHEFCEDCAVWNHEIYCPNCRTFIESTLKVYR